VREIFDAVRARCVPAVWSRGVELTRAGSVVAVSESPDQIVVRVSTRGGLIAPTVTLYLDDGSWECTCGAPARVPTSCRGPASSPDAWATG
jgi:hypothetical protein